MSIHLLSHAKTNFYQTSNQFSGQSDIKKLRRENEMLKKEIWCLRDGYDKLERLIKEKGIDSSSSTTTTCSSSDSVREGNSLLNWEGKTENQRVIPHLLILPTAKQMGDVGRPRGRG